VNSDWAGIYGFLTNDHDPIGSFVVNSQAADNEPLLTLSRCQMSISDLGIALFFAAACSVIWQSLNAPPNDGWQHSARSDTQQKVTFLLGITGP